MENSRFSRAFLLLLALAISALFVAMIRSFLMTILLAGIIAGLASPLYVRLRDRACGGRRKTASILTLLILFVAILAPLLTLLGLVANEAFHISEEVRPWIRVQLDQPDRLMDWLQNIPGAERIAPYRPQILEKLGAMVGKAGNFLFASISATTRGTVAFFFQFFIFLYCLFYFLMDGGLFLAKTLSYLPMALEDKRRMADRFISVTRATLKGTLFIGTVQGTLAGLAFWIAGISSPLFWGTIMTFLSVIPGIGTALIWLPAAIVLFAKGQMWQPIFLLAFCGLVVGSADNLLRPRLVGRDTQMHELLILFGTLGGILLFGILGFIVGPILAALLVTVWDLYGHAFRDLLPSAEAGGPPEASRAGAADSSPGRSREQAPLDRRHLRKPAEGTTLKDPGTEGAPRSAELRPRRPFASRRRRFRQTF